jgi:DNA-binding winged helix-turn-helix (wHTH) protein
MDFRILGPLEVYDGERLLPLGGAKQRSLLAMLLLNANKVVSVERLLDALWGERQPASGAKTLHVYVSQLRKALADHRVVTQPPGYVLRVDPGELDETRFSALRAKADSADPHDAAQLLREALSLWRGGPLADLAYEEFARAEIARLEELRAATIEQRIAVDIELGRHLELAGELEGLVAAYPLRERAARRRRWRPTRLPGGRSSTSSESSRGASCASSRAQSCGRIRRSISSRPPRPASHARREARSSAATQSSTSSCAVSTRRSPAAAACTSSSASPASARAGSARSSSAPRGRAGSRCSSAAAGRPAARPRTGRGCRRCVATFANARR